MLYSLEFRVLGLGFRVYGLSLGFRVYCFVFSVWALGFKL